MRIQLVPGADGADRENGVSMDDRAFFLVEPFLKATWQNPRFSHFGPATIPVEVWAQVLPQLEDIIKVIEAAETPDDIRASQLTSPEVLEDFDNHFGRVQADAVFMLRDFIGIMRSWMQTHDHVYFYGL